MTKSLTEQVYRAVKKDILTCVLAPGSVIVQSQLSERYNTGITPIREALQRLAKENLVSSIPRFGYVVVPVTLVDVQEFFEIRLVLEKAVTRMAVLRATPEEIKRLLNLADYTYVYQDRESYSSFLTNNAEFHLSIAEAGGNRHMVELIRQTLDQLNRVFHLGLDLRDSAEEMRAEHQALALAISLRQADEAGRLVEEQILHSKQRVLDALITTTRGEGGNPGQSIQVVRGRDR